MSGTPSLARVINGAIDNKLSMMNTMLPGRVVRVEVEKGLCDVQPLLRQTFADETVVDYPVITNVPIQNYRAGKSFISLPVHVGDLVELRFSQRSIDIWLATGGIVNPLDPRKFHLSDCVAYPGMYPFNDPPVGATANDVVIKNDQTVVTIKPNGEVQVSASNAIKLLSDLIVLSGDGDAVALASKVLEQLQNIKAAYDTHTHLYSPGPSSPAPTAPPAVPMATPGTVASTKVKAV